MEKRLTPRQSIFPAAASLMAVMLAVYGAGTLKIASVLPKQELSFVMGALAIVASILLTLVAVGKLILSPLDAAARHRRRPTQFTLADFMALVFLFQLPVALMRLALPREASSNGIVYGFAWAASSFMWGLSVRTLSRAGIETPWRRVVFLSAVLPIAYFGSVVFIGGVFFAVAAALFDGPVRAMSGLGWFIAAGALMPAAFYWAAWFVRRMLVFSGHDGNVVPPPTATSTISTRD
ncbi:MAG: hypothetical protein ACREJM_10310 [Candidatus Saccharimonadales bacterium]